MVGFMNADVLCHAAKPGYVTFYSRTRQKLWTKGETSGNRLRVISASQIVDQDTILLRVYVEGDGWSATPAPSHVSPSRWPFKTKAECTMKLRVGYRKAVCRSPVAFLRRADSRLHQQPLYFANTEEPEIECMLIRAQEMSSHVEHGVSTRLTGKDWH